MDGTRFDSLARRLASGLSRRELVKAAIGAAVTAALGPIGANAAACRGPQGICRTDSDCCSGTCGPKDKNGRRYCACVGGQVACGSQCVDSSAFQADVKNCGSCGNTCPSTPCQIGVCASGVCGLAPSAKLVGKKCNDGNSCTNDDVCQLDGSCAGVTKDCSSLVDQCNEAVCDPTTGQCKKVPKSNGTTCNADNNACTNDTCQAGTCVAGTPKDCSAEADQCNTASCNTTTGLCEKQPKADNISCDDGDACTQTDICQGGVCTGSNPIVCDPADQCHQAGVCNPATGTCDYTAKSNGTTCNADNNACTVDTCQTGICTSGAPKDCSTDSTVNDQCNTGVCNQTTGQCEKQAKTDNISCDDGNLCSENDYCLAGVCTAGSATICLDRGSCFLNGRCDPQTGECIFDDAAPGTSCLSGDANCLDGTCCPPDSVCDTESGPVCCQSSESCRSVVTSAGTRNLCCATDLCQVVSVVNGSPTYSAQCCPSGETCASTTISGIPLNRCCPPGEQVMVDPQTFETSCCANPCLTVDLSTFKVSATCCPTGSTCKEFSLNGTTVGICCEGDVEACMTVEFNGTTPTFDMVCCGSNEQCASLDISQTPFGNSPIAASLGVCCAGEAEACLDVGINGSTLTIDPICCGAGEHCLSTSISGSSVQASTCCATEICPIATFTNDSASIDFQCCPANTECATTVIPGGGTEIGKCCAPGESALFDPLTRTTTCCPAVACSVISFSDVGIPTVSAQCCPENYECPTTSFGGQDVGVCCPAGQGLLFDPVSRTAECCENPCTVSNGVMSVGVCCDSVGICVESYGWDGATEDIGYCCPSGQTACLPPGLVSPLSTPTCCDNCQPFSYNGIETAVCCEDGETSYYYSGSVSCASSDSCPMLIGASVVLVACPDGTSCNLYDVVSGTAGVCCAAGEDLYFPVAAPNSPALCCPSDQICAVSDILQTCCPENSHCQSVGLLDLNGCVPDAGYCPVYEDGVLTPTICPTGTTCSQMLDSNSLRTVGGCCTASQSFIAMAGSDDYGCCDPAKVCVDNSDPMLPISTCCAANATCQNGQCVVPS